MKKTVWKLAPYEPFEVDAIAGWLDEMSQKGLQFTSKWGPFCRFERSPSPARYRVDPGRIMLDPTEEERIDAYRHFGWEYCSDYTKYAEVYRAEDPDAPELHTDPDLLEGLVKRTIRDRLLDCLADVIIFFYPLMTAGESHSLWDDWRTDPFCASVPLMCITLPLILLLGIALTFHAWVRVRKERPSSVGHTAHAARWGIFWRGLRLGLMVLFAIGFLLAIIYLALDY